MNNFEDFLRACLDRGADKVWLAPRIGMSGKVEFYADSRDALDGIFEGEVSGKHVKNITGRDSVPLEYKALIDILSREAEEDAERAEAAKAEVARAEAADERWANEGGAAARENDE